MKLTNAEFRNSPELEATRRRRQDDDVSTSLLPSRVACPRSRRLLLAPSLPAGHMQSLSFQWRHCVVLCGLAGQESIVGGGGLTLGRRRRSGKLTLGGRHRRSRQAIGLGPSLRSVGVRMEHVHRHPTARLVVVFAVITLRQMRPVFGVVEGHVAPDHIRRLVGVLAELAFCFPPLALRSGVLARVGLVIASLCECPGALAAEPGGMHLAVVRAHVLGAEVVRREVGGADDARVLIFVALLGLVRRVGVGARRVVLDRHTWSFGMGGDGSSGVCDVVC
jgi:hypothetical protein